MPKTALQGMAPGLIVNFGSGAAGSTPQPAGARCNHLWNRQLSVGIIDAFRVI